MFQSYKKAFKAQMALPLIFCHSDLVLSQKQFPNRFEEILSTDQSFLQVLTR